MDKGPDASHLRRADQDIQQLVWGKAVLKEALRHLGTPYVWGDKEGKKGFDCSGYTLFVFKTFGLELAPTAIGQFQKGIAIERPALNPGDLVFFASGAPEATMHVGIYAGEGEFLHAPGDGQVIQRAKLKAFEKRFVGARRYLLPEKKSSTKLRGKKP